MENNITKILFELLRFSLKGDEISADTKAEFKIELLPEIFKLADIHDLSHLVAVAVINSNLIKENTPEYRALKQSWFMAVQQYEAQNKALRELCTALEEAKISFIPLKGSVLRNLYPEPWMRTSCDIDVLVHPEDIDKAIEILSEKLGCRVAEKGSHDISLFIGNLVHIELHFDLVEDGRANNARDILKNVWSYAHKKEGFGYYTELSDEMFYFYHIAHMAKHFEIGGCGIRTFIDLWMLDKNPGNDKKRKNLLEKGKLHKFCEYARKLSKVWLEKETADIMSQQMEQFVLCGGAFGSKENYVVIQQHKKGGRFGYLMFKVFMPYDILKFKYPILQKQRWLTPVMEVRRWFRLIFCGRLKHSVNELKFNQNISDEMAENMYAFLKNIGL